MAMQSSKTCIIGAGPAGLAAARALRLKGLDWDLFETHDDVGGIWDIARDQTPMYESAHFISSKTMSGFEGFPMPEDYPDYPSHRQILAYIRDFADLWGLRDNIAFNTTVTDIEKLPDGRWRVTRDDGRSDDYMAVICATGANWHPRMPDLEGHFSGEIRHAFSYRRADEFRGKRVLVVGAGNSGVDIACDAAANARRALISVRRGYHFIPKHIFGIPADVFAHNGPKLPLWLERPIFSVLLRMYVGDLTRLGLPRPDHRLFETHPILNSQILHYLQHGDLHVKPDIERLDGDDVVFRDGTREAVDLILLATGYTEIQPYARDYFTYEGGRPELYLQMFSREHANLFAPSFLETNSGAFKLFDTMGLAMANYLHDQRAGAPTAARMAARIEQDRPDLSGGIRFVASDRHAGYFDSDTWQAYLRKLYRRMGWMLPEREIAAASPPRRPRPAGPPA